MTDLAERGEDRDEGRRDRSRPVAAGGMSGLQRRAAVLPAAVVAVLGIATVAFALQGGRSATTTTIVLIAAAVLTALVLIAAVRGAAGVTRRLRRELAARPGADLGSGPGVGPVDRDQRPRPGDRDEASRPGDRDEASRPGSGVSDRGEAPRPTAQAAPAVPDQRVEVLGNVSRRMQSLVHREIQLLDELERQVEDPDLLAGLFAVDHLATRLRRQAETLAVLGGAASRRQWSRPVPVHEVLRAAVAEVDHYARVTVVPPVPSALPGDAVTDVTHLMAELIENAAKFSAPHTKAVVRAELDPAGLVIQVEDHGLGMQAADLQRMNALLADPVQADLAEVARDGRIGLFVAAMLARRHGITVQLQTTGDGGIQAAVVLPAALLEPMPPPARERPDAEPAPQDAAPGPRNARPAPRNATLEPQAAGPARRIAEPAPLDAGLAPQAAVIPPAALLEATPAPTLPARRRQDARREPRAAAPEPQAAAPEPQDAGPAPREPGPRRARHRQAPAVPDAAGPVPLTPRRPQVPTTLPARRISRSAVPAATPADIAPAGAAAPEATVPEAAPVETQLPASEPTPLSSDAEGPALPRRARQPRTAPQPQEPLPQPSDDPAADPPPDVLGAFQRGVSQAAEEDR